MKSRRFAWLGIAVLPASGASGTPALTLRPPPTPGRRSAARRNPHALVEPPDVDVSALPLECRRRTRADPCGTQGRPRRRPAILLSLRMGRWRTKTSRRRFARQSRRALCLRIVNDLRDRAAAKARRQAAIPRVCRCRMPAPATARYVGYLNHTIEDRWTPRSPLDTNVHFHGYEGPPEREENIFLSTLSTPMHACEYHVTIPRLSRPELTCTTRTRTARRTSGRLGLDGVGSWSPGSAANRALGAARDHAALSNSGRSWSIAFAPGRIGF